MSNTLPQGWACLTAQDGRPYYFNSTTNETTWSPPGGGGAPAAAPAAAQAPQQKQEKPAKGGAAYNEAAGDHRYSLASLVAKTGQKDQGQGFFELERDKLLEINLDSSNQFAWIKNGCMVARRGNVKFSRQKMSEQGLSKVIKKKVTGEGVKLVKCEGQGKVFCADMGKSVSVLQLNGESISVNGNDVLALSGSLKYDIKLMKGAGSMSGGLFNCKISGQGMVAFTCHGSVVTLSATPQDPVYTDPNATVAWTHDPKPVVDMNAKAIFGRTTGEEFQLCFTNGHVIIQPYEELSPYAQASGGGGGGGGGGGKAAGSAFGELLGAL